MQKRHFTFVVLGLMLFNQVAWAQEPTEKQIVTWLTNKKDIVAEEVKPESVHIGQTVAINLASGEQAYLSEVEYDNAGRNFSSGYILTRPSLKQSRHLTQFAGLVSDIEVLSRQRKATLLKLATAGSGQGVMESGEVVLSFNQWKPIVHYQSHDYDDFGYGSEERGCTRVESKLVFKDGDPAKLTDMVTTLHQKDCDNPKTAKTTTKTTVKTIKW